MRIGRLRAFGLAAALTCAAVAAGASAPAASTPEVFVQLGDLLLAESRFREAADAYRRAKRDGGEAVQDRAWRGLVRALLRSADFAGARREADELASARPHDPDALALHGDALWSAGLFIEAEGRYRDALSIAPEHARSRHGLARVLSARHELGQAVEQVQAAIARAPADTEFHHTLGFINERLGRFAEAARALQQYVNLLRAPERDERVLLTRVQIRFFESFGSEKPYEMDRAVAERVHVVPFRLVHDKIVVEGRVNGGRAVDLVLDTGAEMTVLSQPVAQRAGVPALGFTVSAGVGESGLRGLQLGRIDELEIGTFRMRRVPTLIKYPPLRGVPTREGESWSPLALGLSMTIDYARRLLTFGRGLEQHGQIEMPLYLHRLAMVRGTINDREAGAFIVDTGGEVISISEALSNALGPYPGRRIPLKVHGISGWDRDAHLRPGLDLAFDRVRFENFSTVVLNLKAPSLLLGLELGGIVGHRFLSRYQVGLDLQNGKLTLTESPSASASPRVALGVVPSPPQPSDDRHRSPE